MQHDCVMIGEHEKILYLVFPPFFHIVVEDVDELIVPKIGVIVPRSCFDLLSFA